MTENPLNQTMWGHGTGEESNPAVECTRHVQKHYVHCLISLPQNSSEVVFELLFPKAEMLSQLTEITQPGSKKPGF